MGRYVLKFSIPKCHVLNITRAIKHKIAYDYYLHNTPLEVVDSCKYLGATIQHDLRWSEHIHNIAVKANSTLSFLQRNLKFNNPYLKETAYFSLVQPKLENAWSLRQRTEIQNLQKINLRAARFVTLELPDLSQIPTIAPTVYPT